MILITCAVAKELEFLAPQPHVEVLVTGVGPIEAAAHVSRALAHTTYDLIINAGIGGAIPPPGASGADFTSDRDAVELEIGSGVVVSEELVQLDLETDKPLDLPPAITLHDRVSSDFTLVDRLVELGFEAVRGITVGRVTATDETAERLAKLGAEVETMEGFSVLRSAAIAGVPAIEVRGISNRVGEREFSGWNFAAGVAGLEKILTALLPIAIEAYGKHDA